VLAGTLLGDRLPDRLRETLMHALGLVTLAGGILILGISLRLLELKQVRVGNLLPALVFAPAAVAIAQAVVG
jgi:uncharacterized membrane protein YqgA involved in biofilm formation